jgi:TPR repeat protein
MQYPKAIAWCLLSASKSNIFAQGSIGEFYQYGIGLPSNPLCALKWYLKVTKLDTQAFSLKCLVEMFEYGQGIPVDKDKALEWYHHGGEKEEMNRLKNRDFHQYTTEKSK